MCSLPTRQQSRSTITFHSQLERSLVVPLHGDGFVQPLVRTYGRTSCVAPRGAYADVELLRDDVDIKVLDATPVIMQEGAPSPLSPEAEASAFGDAMPMADLREDMDEALQADWLQAYQKEDTGAEGRAVAECTSPLLTSTEMQAEWQMLG